MKKPNLLCFRKLIWSGQGNYFPLCAQTRNGDYNKLYQQDSQDQYAGDRNTNEHQCSPAGYWVWATLLRPIHSAPQKCDCWTTHVHYFLQTNIRKWYSKASMSTNYSCARMRSLRLCIWRIIRPNFAKFYTNRKSDNIKLIIFTASTCHHTLFSPQLCNAKTRGVAQKPMLLLWT